VKYAKSNKGGKSLKDIISKEKGAGKKKLKEPH